MPPFVAPGHLYSFDDRESPSTDYEIGEDVPGVPTLGKRNHHGGIQSAPFTAWWDPDQGEPATKRCHGEGLQPTHDKRSQVVRRDLKVPSDNRNEDTASTSDQCTGKTARKVRTGSQPSETGPASPSDRTESIQIQSQNHSEASPEADTIEDSRAVFDPFPTHTSSGRARTRIAQACEPCRKRKHKCDGPPICTRCTRKGLTCVWDPIPPGVKGLPTSTLASILAVASDMASNDTSPLAEDLEMESESLLRTTAAERRGAGARQWHLIHPAVSTMAARSKLADGSGRAARAYAASRPSKAQASRRPLPAKRSAAAKRAALAAKKKVASQMTVNAATRPSQDESACPDRQVNVKPIEDAPELSLPTRGFGRQDLAPVSLASTRSPQDELVYAPRYVKSACDDSDDSESDKDATCETDFDDRRLSTSTAGTSVASTTSVLNSSRRPSLLNNQNLFDQSCLPPLPPAAFGRHSDVLMDAAVSGIELFHPGLCPSANQVPVVEQEPTTHHLVPQVVMSPHAASVLQSSNLMQDVHYGYSDPQSAPPIYVSGMTSCSPADLSQTVHANTMLRTDFNNSPYTSPWTNNEVDNTPSSSQGREWLSGSLVEQPYWVSDPQVMLPQGPTSALQIVHQQHSIAVDADAFGPGDATQ